MKKLAFTIVFIIGLASCHFDKNIVSNNNKSIAKQTSDTIRIANDSLQYEVIIIDLGYNSWLAGKAKPRGYYSENYLESRNQIYATEWNNRVLQPQRYASNLYEMQIDYNRNIHYGYEVNYLIYNYFIYFQLQYKQQLSGFVPRP